MLRREGDDIFLTELSSAIEDRLIGKGMERHGTSEKFEDQPIIRIPELLGPVGLGFPLGQIMKKCQETAVLPSQDAIKELQDVIVYALGAIIHLRRTEEMASEE